MKITAIKRRKGPRNEVNVYLGETRLTLSTEIATAAHLRIGQEMDEGRLATLRAQQEAWRCREMALSLLSYRPRSHRELRDRLVRRDIRPEVVDEILEGLSRAKLIDDEAFALALVADRLRSRPVGRSRMIAELRAKGVDAEHAEEAYRRVFDELGTSEIELARRAARKFRPRRGEDPLRARRRLYAFLGRRGFGGDAVRAVIDELLDGSGSELDP